MMAYGAGEQLEAGRQQHRATRQRALPSHWTTVAAFAMWHKWFM